MARSLGPVEYGGPDLEPRRLRNLLQDHVEASPAGSRIDWATYYFRDRALAEALMRASDRGVRVKLVVEPDPRLAGANDAVISMLGDHGLAGGFHLYRPAPNDEGHLHAKIYAFSDPGICWIGSFNPSGDAPEDADVIAEIGDQDRGHNLLLGIRNARLVKALRRHVARLATTSRIPLYLRPGFNRPIWTRGTILYFYPRVRPYLVEKSLKRLKSGDRLCGAISHLKGREFVKQVENAVGRGARVELLAHDTLRRVPERVVEALGSAGANIIRVSHPDGLPMHAKFLLVETGQDRVAWVGSYNFNKMSRRHNAEILLKTYDPSIFESLEQRFAAISAMAHS